MPQYSYYDIDTILAEEELVPCTTLLQCRHLAHLDPDYLTHAPVQPQDDEDHDYSADAAGKRQRGGAKTTGKRSRSGASSVARHLPEGSRIKMPLWSVDKWSNLGFVRLGLPRHFGRNARERLQADPSVADLRYVALWALNWHACVGVLGFGYYFTCHMRILGHDSIEHVMCCFLCIV